VPTGAQIGTNTHWNNGHKLWGSVALSARKRARSTTHTALAPNGLDRLNPNLVQKPIGAMGTSYGVGVCAARAIWAAQPTRASAERENERESTGMEQGAATAASAKFECGARAARISRVAQSKTK
jgi:hypothetical protein